MTPTTEPRSTADGVAWNLADLYAGPDDRQLAQDLQSAKSRAEAFEHAYRGKIATLAPDQSAVLLTAVRKLEGLYEQMDRSAVYAMLWHSARTDDPPRGALLSRTQEERTRINKHLIFFDLEWVTLPDATARALTAQPDLARYRHYLEQKRAWRPHYLSEAEEKVLDEKGITGRSAFNRLFEETGARLTFTLRTGDASSPLPQTGGEGRPEQTLSLQEILAKLYDPDRAVRRAAAAGISAGLRANERLLTFIFNTVVLDHDVDMRLRHFAGPMDSRNLANEITPAVVEALLSATERHFPLVQRYYRLKGRLLGLDKLYDYDRYAPLSGELPKCDWPTARRIVQESYDAFSPDAGAVVRQFFDKRWVDAELRTGKRGGAFSSSAVPSVHPYILMNFTDRLRDVMTLAHELGHGLHQYLSRGQGYLQCDTPLTTAEMASVFGEMLTFRRLQEIYPEPKPRLAMLCGKIEDAFATVFRQVVMTRFEQALHRARKEEGELSGAAIDALWLGANRAMFGDTLELTDGYACWWSYIGHFIRSPFYCYAYSFGELLVLALYQKYRQDGPAFVPRYMQLLASGGSDAPHVLLAKLGVDVTDPSFWELGLRLLTEMVAEAERLAAEAQ